MFSSTHHKATLPIGMGSQYGSLASSLLLDGPQNASVDRLVKVCRSRRRYGTLRSSEAFITRQMYVRGGMERCGEGVRLGGGKTDV